MIIVVEKFLFIFLVLQLMKGDITRNGCSLPHLNQLSALFFEFPATYILGYNSKRY
jgi:hypothetical protein